MKKRFKTSFCIRSVLISTMIVITIGISSCGNIKKQEEVVFEDTEMDAEDEAVEDTDSTEKEIFERMLEANELFNKMTACQSEYNDKMDKITREIWGCEKDYLAITYPGINSVQDFLEMAEKYYTKEVAENIMPYAECMIEENGKLYVTSNGRGGIPIVVHKVEIEQIDESQYDITVTTYYDEDIFESHSESLKYIYTVNGWVFDSKIPFYFSPDVEVYLESDSNNQ